MMMEDEASRPRYVIGVAARLLGTSSHTLRSLDRRELLTPSRSQGNIRLYSDRDLALARHILELRQQGVNWAGIKVILEMEKERTEGG